MSKAPLYFQALMDHHLALSNTWSIHLVALNFNLSNYSPNYQDRALLA
jgi:hypothetical protein